MSATWWKVIVFRSCKSCTIMPMAVLIGSFLSTRALTLGGKQFLYCLGTQKIYVCPSCVQELNMCKKRKTAMLVYGNSNLYLNTLFVQCPICGSVVNPGNLKEIFVKNDKLVRYIRLTEINSLH